MMNIILPMAPNRANCPVERHVKKIIPSCRVCKVVGSVDRRLGPIDRIDPRAEPCRPLIEDMDQNEGRDGNRDDRIDDR